MKDNSFTILWFLPYINMNHPQVYIYPLPPEPHSHLLPHPTALRYHITLGWTPCSSDVVCSFQYLFLFQGALEQLNRVFSVCTLSSKISLKSCRQLNADIKRIIPELVRAQFDSFCVFSWVGVIFLIGCCHMNWVCLGPMVTFKRESFFFVEHGSWLYGFSGFLFLDLAER